MAEKVLDVILRGKGQALRDEFRSIGAAAEEAGIKTQSGWQKASKSIQIAGAVIGGVAIAIAGASVKLADDYEKSHARLLVALANTHTSWKAQASAIDAASASAAKFGLGTRTDVEATLAQMTTGMGSASKALQNFQLVENLAAARGIDLAQAGLLITKASEGQIRPLRQLGIDLPVAAAGALKVQKAEDALHKAQFELLDVQSKYQKGLINGKVYQADYQKAQEKLLIAQQNLNTVQNTGSFILSQLSQKLGGSAAAQAATFSGKLHAMEDQAKNVGISIGLWLIPKLTVLLGWLQKGVEWLQKHAAVAKALAIILGGIVVAAIIAYTVHMVAAAVATLAAVGPILLVIAAVAVMAAGAIYLWTHWNQVWGWIQHHPAYAALIAVLFPITAAIFGIVGAAKWLQQNWAWIWPSLQAIAGVAINNIMIFLGPLITVMQTLLHVTQGVADAFNAVANSIPQIPTPSVHLPGAPKGGLYLPTPFGSFKVPGTATGGIVTGPQLRLVGEAGPEAIVPLPRMGHGDTYVTVNVNGIVSGHAHEVGKFIVDHAVMYERKTGKRWLAVNNG